MQTKYILNNIFNDNILNNLGIVNKDNIFGVFLLGDTNSGTFFDRCNYPNPCNGEPIDAITADDCIDKNGQKYENVFNLFEKSNLINAPNIKYEPHSLNFEPLCTQCTNPNVENYNPLIDSSSDYFIYDPNIQLDLDHIFIQGG